jgi:hypothetical protein
MEFGKLLELGVKVKAGLVIRIQLQAFTNALESLSDLAHLQITEYGVNS